MTELSTTIKKVFYKKNEHKNKDCHSSNPELTFIIHEYHTIILFSLRSCELSKRNVAENCVLVCWIARESENRSSISLLQVLKLWLGTHICLLRQSATRSFPLKSDGFEM